MKPKQPSGPPMTIAGLGSATAWPLVARARDAGRN